MFLWLLLEIDTLMTYDVWKCTHNCVYYSVIRYHTAETYPARTISKIMTNDQCLNLQYHLIERQPSLKAMQPAPTVVRLNMTNPLIPKPSVKTTNSQYLASCCFDVKKQ